MKKVVIIGGGASGLVAAIYAAKAHHKVTILERNSHVGKKILATGNGKCNYFNVDQSLTHYHTTNPEKIETIINPKNTQEILEFLDSIGIVPKIKNGYYYPNSGQAISMREALFTECQLLNIKIINDYKVNTVTKQGSGFIINNEITADKVIIATGSKAAPNTGSDGNGYSLAESLNHTVIKPLPALVQLLNNDKQLKSCSGARSDVNVSLIENDKLIKTESGELQLTDYGVSGICIFNLSRYVAKGLEQKKKEEIIINFLPNIKNFIDYMNKRNSKVKGRTISKLFDGLLNYKIADILIEKAGISKNTYWNKLTEKEKETLGKCVCKLKVNIIGTKDFNKAQVCSGGIPLEEINPKTMESLKVKGLYFSGEILDVDGDCGGYNLTFAFITGMLAGKGK